MGADKKNAEQAVALAALEELRSDPGFAMRIDAPKVKKQYNPGGGFCKGKGKGKGKFFKGGGFKEYLDPSMSSNMTPLGGGGDMSSLMGCGGHDFGMGAPLY